MDDNPTERLRATAVAVRLLRNRRRGDVELMLLLEVRGLKRFIEG